MATSDASADPFAPFDYAGVTPAAIGSGCEAAMRGAEALVDELASVPEGQRTFQNTLQPLEEIADLLDQAGGRYGFLSQVATDAAIRETAHEYEERLDTFATALGFREEISRAVRAYADSAEGRSLEGDAARLLAHELRDFRRNGMDLSPQKRRHVQERQERLVSLSIAFRRNIDEYDDALLLSRDQLAGLPDSYIQGLRTEEVNGETQYRVSLDYPELFPFLESADDGAFVKRSFARTTTRRPRRIWRCWRRPWRCATTSPRPLATAPGPTSCWRFASPRTAHAVGDFLDDLERRVAFKARADMEVLRESRRGHLDGDAPVQIWDWRYYTQRVLREEHRVDPFEVAEYFPLDAVLEGLFAVYQTLVGVRFLPHAEARPWHPDVRLFDIVDAREEQLLGHFYLDLHPRPDKFGHAAAFPLRNGRLLADGTYQRPISAMVANFTKPTAVSPSLLRHSEVITLFPRVRPHPPPDADPFPLSPLCRHPRGA